MKVKLVDPLKLALRSLTQAVDPATGAARRYRTLDALKAACPVEDVVAHCLEQEPENPGANRLKFLCFRHDDHTPSLWVNVEEQRWGCHAGCFGGRSDDVLGFVRQVYGLSHKDGGRWLDAWAMYHARPRAIRVRLRRERIGGR